MPLPARQLARARDYEDCIVSEYRVELDVFTGPLDLLLYLIRRDEVDIQDIPVARVAEQYIEYVHLLEQIDPNAAGEFLVLAATLAELKSRALLPTPPIEPLDESDDPRVMLVRQLLEYKRFKDAARRLGSAADERAARFERSPANLPPELREMELEDVEVWDLLAAFGKVMASIGQGPGLREIRYDDTPIEVYSTSIVETLEMERSTTFEALFSNRRDRAEVIGLFLALLELIRRRRVRAEQERVFGTIYLFLREDEEEAAAAFSAAPVRGVDGVVDSQRTDGAESRVDADDAFAATADGSGGDDFVELGSLGFDARAAADESPDDDAREPRRDADSSESDDEQTR